MKEIELRFDPPPSMRSKVVATAQEDIRAGDLIEIDARTGKAQRVRFGDATAAEIGEQALKP